MIGIFLFIIVFFGLIVSGILRSSPEHIGKAGEKRVSSKLRWLPKEYIVLNDIMLPTQYGTTQIDHVIVSPYGIFVIETKNYKGWIFGHENSEDWKQSLLGKKSMWGWSSEQHKFRNPIRQNKAHTKAIKMLVSEIGEFPIIPIVVFSNNADLRITTPNHIVINWSSIRSAIKQFNRPCISDQDTRKIIDKITSANIVEEEARKSHTSSVQQIQQTRHQLIANKICPMCHSELVVRKGRFGTFLGCSNYPKCKFTSQID